MGNIADDIATPSEPTCDECGAPLDEEGECTSTAPCLAKVEHWERRVRQAKRN